ncbi:MAG: phosphoribosyltransferase [Verrucomicrobia bacterium]|nr:MAG: phosphoribosyltransferase [Verrucomicrobiota bacterium]
MPFASREDAGRQLGNYLREEGIQTDLVLGLPRGGVIVAAQVAAILQRPLDVLVVRKIGHPQHREYAAGALAEPDVVILDELPQRMIPSRVELDAVIAEETIRLREYRERFHPGGIPDLRNLSVTLVDDGIATGATTRAAVLAARKRGARKIFVAAPVASPEAVHRLRSAADSVIVLIADPSFQAVGQYYAAFEQTTDEEVLALLHATRG